MSYSWDFNPPRNAGEEYTRGHRIADDTHDLTDFDVLSRYPRPPAFNPRK